MIGSETMPVFNSNAALDEHHADTLDRVHGFARIATAQRLTKEQLSELLPLLGSLRMAFDSFNDLVSVFPIWTALKKRCARLEPAKVEAKAAFEKVDALRKEKEHVLKQYDGKIQAAKVHNHSLNAEVIALTETTQELAEMQWKHSELLDVERPDLSKITPLYNGQTFNDEAIDPAAPRVPVAYSAYAFESHRRMLVLHAALIIKMSQRAERYAKECEGIRDFHDLRWAWQMKTPLPYRTGELCWSRVFRDLPGLRKLYDRADQYSKQDFRSFTAEFFLDYAE